MNDKDLVERLKLDDTQALDLVITNYSRYVVTVIINRLGDAFDMEDAKELASCVFFSLWKHRRELHTDRLRGWLAAAARNEALSFLRKRRAETVSEEDCSLIDDKSPQLICEQGEKAAFLRNALDTLDPRSREIIVRHYYYNQSVAAIASQMSLTASNVKVRLMRGRIKLKGVLLKGGYGNED